MTYDGYGTPCRFCPECEAGRPCPWRDGLGAGRRLDARPDLVEVGVPGLSVVVLPGEIPDVAPEATRCPLSADSNPVESRLAARHGRQYRTSILALAICMLAIMHALSAAAQDATPIPTGNDAICFPRAEAASLLSSYAEAPLLRAKVSALEQDLALKDRALDAYAKLQQLDEQIIGKEQRLRQLAEAERDVFKDQKDRAEGKNRWLKCGAGAGFGAAFGTGIMPGIGTAGGAIVGCLGGLLGL